MSNLRELTRGEGKDWNSNESIAFGKGVIHDEFRGLQSDLNLFADELGYGRLELDGFIGPKTAAAINKVIDAVLAKNALLATSLLFPRPKTKEDVAQYALYIRAWLGSAAKSTLLG